MHIKVQIMVHLRIQYLELHNKVTNRSTKGCTWDCTWERIWVAFVDALIGAIKRANGFKIWHIKGALYSAPGDAQEIANGGTINAFESVLDVQLSCKYRSTRRCIWGCT